MRTTHLVGIVLGALVPGFLVQAGGTPYLVKDINPTGFSAPIYLTKVGDRLFFNADDGVHGQELWVSDGTEAGTYMVVDLLPGAEGSNPFFLQAAGGPVLFPDRGQRRHFAPVP